MSQYLFAAFSVKSRILPILLLVLVLLAAACGSSQSDNSNSSSDAQPQEKSAASEEVADVVEQVDDTPMDVGGRGEVIAESAVDPQDARNRNAQAITAVDNYLTAALGNIDRAWTYWFTSIGFNEPFVSYVVLTPADPPLRSRCANVVIDSYTNNAYYCSAVSLRPGFTGTIYLPAVTMLRMWSGDIFERQSKRAGD